MAVLVYEDTGQSNVVYPGRGEVYSNAAVRLFYYNPTTSDTSGDLWIDMKGNTADHGGYAATVVRLLLAAGIPKIAVLQSTYGSSPYNRWDPNGPYLAPTILTHRAIALQGLRAQFPGENVFYFVHVRNQGTSDMQVNNLSYQQGWAAGTDLWHNALAAQNIQYGFAPHIIKMAVMSFTGLDVSYFLPTIEQQQLIWVGGTPDPDPTKIGNSNKLVKLENSAAYDQSDFTHMIPGPATINGVVYPGGGFQWGGTIIASQLLTELKMGNLAPGLRTSMVNHIRNKGAYSPAANHTLHLYADDACTVPLTSGTASGYAAQTKTNNTTTWPAPSGRSVSNGVAFTFTPTGTWPDVRGWKLTDNATEGAGTVLAQNTCTPTPVNLTTGPAVFGIGAITVVAPTNVGVGGFADAIVNGLLGLIFGGTAYSPAWITTDYGSHWAGDPAGAGTQAGSRVSMTQASTWAAASSALAQTSADITLAQQVTGTYWAEHDAAAAGNLLFTATRPAAVGTSGTIFAGQVQTIIT